MYEPHSDNHYWQQLSLKYSMIHYDTLSTTKMSLRKSQTDSRACNIHCLTLYRTEMSTGYTWSSSPGHQCPNVRNYSSEHLAM